MALQTSNRSKFGPNVEMDSNKDELWVSNSPKLEKGPKGWTLGEPLSKL